jgi:hypothetical protein
MVNQEKSTVNLGVSPWETIRYFWARRDSYLCLFHAETNSPSNYKHRDPTIWLFNIAMENHHS